MEAAKDASCVACTVPKAVEPVRNRRSQLIILGAQGSGAEGVSQLLSSLNMQRADGRGWQANFHASLTLTLAVNPDPNRTPYS